MKKIKQNLKWITLALVMIIIIGGFLIKWSLSNKEMEPVIIEELELSEPETTETEEEITIPKNIYVDIKGAVKNPGVYEVAEDKKVVDVVGLAGGFTDNANTSMINLAKKVTNEMVIIIYTEEEVKKATEPDTIIKVVDKQCICPEIKNDACLNQESNSNATNDTTTENGANNQKVNINSATLEELLTLDGIGESKAKAIIEHREENGEFKTIEDIKEVSGIGETLYEKIKDNITV